jgi:hypothetical protein
MLPPFPVLSGSALIIFSKEKREKKKVNVYAGQMVQSQEK